MADLRKLQPTIYKATLKEIRHAAKPLQQEAQSRVPGDPPLSGMGHGGRTGWSRKGTRVSTRTGGKSQRNGWTLVKIQMNGAAGSLFDIVGRGSNGKTPQGAALIDGLNARFRQASRAMWPAAEAKLDYVQRNVVQAIDKASATMNLTLKREWL